ncbi:hypothetical protein [Paragemmobacter straminiformis]|uniref:Uncharacterized protein n=1 Tax=Paragemmobacter straminiformis TaxID=2045119 RepID=A0A842I911_9RHOB|nr:hypothetical protein [Gemmobacter straminiformis]MBC2836106.1 hypothetical protein [Gemmobacter straminiformis]
MSLSRSIVSDDTPRNAYAAERMGLIGRSVESSNIARNARILAAIAFVAVNAMILGSLSPEAMAATENVTSIYQNLGAKN